MMCSLDTSVKPGTTLLSSPLFQVMETSLLDLFWGQEQMKWVSNTSLGLICWSSSLATSSCTVHYKTDLRISRGRLLSRETKAIITSSSRSDWNVRWASSSRREDINSSCAAAIIIWKLVNGHRWNEISKNVAWDRLLETWHSLHKFINSYKSVAQRWISDRRPITHAHLIILKDPALTTIRTACARLVFAYNDIKRMHTWSISRLLCCLRKAAILLI